MADFQQQPGEPDPASSPTSSSAGDVGGRASSLPPSHLSANLADLADLFDEVLAIDPSDRDAFLASLAKTRPETEAELRELLAELPDAESREAVERAERGEQDPFAGEPVVGETIGGCVLESVIGRGGVGTVYAAQQLQPARSVAVKVLRAGGKRQSQQRRFRTEAFALGRLVHPVLARIYSSGTAHRDGLELPYIVMERIDGSRDFVDWARGAGVTRRDIALRMADICDGMQHGHSRGVIHRDLKPSNILVDGAGQPHVIDFGIARLVSDELDRNDTVAGALIGTPAYMAPEQFELAPEEVDIRIDIHALGVILYEVLAGRRPYEIPRHLYFDAAGIMRATEAPAPRLVDSTVPRDLSAIAMKAMAKDRDLRYATMSEFAADLRAFADGRSVRARAESGPERLLRTMRRHRAWTVAIAVSAAALVTAITVSIVALREAQHRLAHASIQLATSAAERGDVPGAREVELDGGSARIESPTVVAMIKRLADDSVRPVLNAGPGHMMAGAISLDGTRYAAFGDGGNAVIDLRTGEASIHPNGVAGTYYAVGFSYDGTRVFGSDEPGNLLEVLPNGEVRSIGAIGMSLRGIAAAADGDRLLLLASGQAGVLRLSTGKAEFTSLASSVSLGGIAWNGVGRAYGVLGDRTVAALEVPESGPPARVASFHLDTNLARSVALSPDKMRVAVGTNSGEVLIANAETGAIERRMSVRHDVWSVAFSRDGRVIHAGERAGRVHSFRVETGELLAVRSILSEDPVWALGEAFDGTIVASIGGKVAYFGSGYQWSERPQPFPSRRPRAMQLVDSHTIRAVGVEGVVQQLDLARGIWAEVEHGRLGNVAAAAFTSDGKTVASWGGTTIAITELATGARVECGAYEPVNGKTFRLAWNSDGTRLAAVGLQSVHVFARDGTPVASAPVNTREHANLEWYAPDRFAILSGVAERFDCVIANGKLETKQMGITSCTNIRFSGRRWIVPLLNGNVLISQESPVRSTDALTGVTASKNLSHADVDYQFLLRKHRDYALGGAVSPDGELVATYGADGTVRLWLLATGEPITTFTVHSQQVAFLDWLPDGSGIVSMGNLGEVRLLDTIPRAQRMMTR